MEIHLQTLTCLKEQKETIFFLRLSGVLLKIQHTNQSEIRIMFFFKVSYPVVLLLRRNNKQLNSLHYLLLQHGLDRNSSLSREKNCLKRIKCASNFAVVINSGLAHYGTLRNMLLCLICWLKFQSISYETL